MTNGNLLWQKATDLSVALCRSTESLPPKLMAHRTIDPIYFIAQNTEDIVNRLDECRMFNDFREHKIVEGVVVLVNCDEAWVDIGYMQKIAIPKKELAYPEPDSAEDVVKTGDKIRV